MTFQTKIIEIKTTLLTKETPVDVKHLTESNGIFVSIPYFQINAINVHLHCSNRSIRLRQLESLLPNIPKERCILGGDFNDRTERFSLRDFLSCSKALGPTTIYGSCIDDILYTPDVKIESPKVVRKRFGLMDHYPIIATVV